MSRSRSKSVAGPATPSGDPLDTPMMRQYLELKKNYTDAILFFRMGDFYEMFLEDAQIAAPLMDVALTARANRIPMAGVPYHSMDTYVARLIGAGQKVAIAEQHPDPVNPKLMRRSVTRIVTPGTLVEESLLESASHNYLLAITSATDKQGVTSLGLAVADVSTGDFSTFGLAGRQAGKPASDNAAALNEHLDEDLAASLRDCYFRYAPREVLVPAGMLKIIGAVLPEANSSITGLEDWKASPTEGARRIEQTFGTDLRGLGHDDGKHPSLGAASLVLHYLERIFPGRRIELSPPVFSRGGSEHMLLDEQTIRNLDLVYNYQEGNATRSLFGVLNHCLTAPGKRFLKEALTAPLVVKERIEQRQKDVSGFLENAALSRGLREQLELVHDLERTLSRNATGRGAPRDCTAIRQTVAATETIASLLPKGSARLAELISVGPRLKSLARWVEANIEKELPAVLGKGRLLREKVSAELDQARLANGNAVQWMLEFESAERERTGLTSLRVKYNKIVGYFIEISKAQSNRAPADYERRQTLVNAERFGSERLADLEKQIVEADEIIERIEREAFEKFQEMLLETRQETKQLMRGLAQLDFLLALAQAAGRLQWCRPNISSGGELTVEDGRHPVVEAFLESGQGFVPNVVKMNASERSFALITGPNMAGKSTYIRQVALIQLLMQIGSYVPARYATMAVVDRIFTRIGASDNLTRGESTFYVEMLESARILNQATEDSLVIMDEVGRGTSTYDGLSIAWAVAEYFSGDSPPRPRVLFATHYHELTVLESRDGVFNLTMDVQESNGRVIFMHRVREGAADRSYGIHVARLAGLPPEVTARAEQKLAELESDYEREKKRPPTPSIRGRSKVRAPESDTVQGSLFDS